MIDNAATNPTQKMRSTETLDASFPNARARSLPIQLAILAAQQLHDAGRLFGRELGA